jgi:hypothetical protein
MAETDRFQLVVCIVPEREIKQLRFTANTFHVVGPIPEPVTQEDFEKQLEVYGFCAFERTWPERTRYQLHLAELVKEARENGISLEDAGLAAAAEIQQHLKARQ